MFTMDTSTLVVNETHHVPIIYKDTRYRAYARLYADDTFDIEVYLEDDETADTAEGAYEFVERTMGEYFERAVRLL